MRPDFVYGNTRLRARLPGLLRGVDVLDEPLDDQQIGVWYRHELRQVRDLYTDSAADIVGVLLARHDLADTLALLRGARSGAPSAERLRAVLAVGAVTESAARDIAGALDGVSAIERLVTYRLPDPQTAAGLRAAWSRLELTDDPNEFETSIATAAFTHWLSVLDSAGAAADPVRELVLAEGDRADVVVALGAPTGQPFRPLPSRALRSTDLHGGREQVLAAAAAAHTEWADALRHFDLDWDWLALSAALDHVIRVRALRGLRSGDPLGAAIPLGYVIAVECHARTLRISRVVTA